VPVARAICARDYSPRSTLQLIPRFWTGVGKRYLTLPSPWDYFRVAENHELCLAQHFFDRRLPQGLPNIYANLLNGIVPIAEPIPL
jgi:hypothetical protein